MTVPDPTSVDHGVEPCCAHCAYCGIPHRWDCLECSGEES